MLLTRPTAINIAFWQWVNQTYYAGVNYANRSGTATFTNRDLATAYGSAVGASILVGLGLKKMISPFDKYFTGSKKFFFTFLIAFLANSSANATNLYCMRRGELETGVAIQSPEGEYLGHSQKAGKMAVY